MKPPIYTIFDNIDPKWVLEQSQWIIKNIPMTESSMANGKFYDTYKCWRFYKTSEIPLIKKFVSLINKHTKKFKQLYSKPCILNFIVLAYTSDDSQEMCIWHKDKYFIDGQFHITIKGNANIAVDDNGSIKNILVPNGSVWYLNGKHYLHKINIGTGNERFELCAQMNQLEEDVNLMKQAVSNNKWKNIEGDHPKFLALKERVSNGVDQAMTKGTSSGRSNLKDKTPFRLAYSKDIKNAKL